MSQEPRGSPEIPEVSTWKAFAPDGITWATLSKTPSDVRSFRNARAKFRRWCRDRRLEPGI